MRSTNKSDDHVAPTHLGFILDGNRRWARARNLPTLEGHRQGYETLKEISRAAFDRGASYVSAYVFSTENWNRTQKEVGYLMDFTLQAVTRDLQELNKENIKLVWLGNREKLSEKLVKALDKAEESTKDNTRGTLAICFNYGGHQELVDAVRWIAAEGLEAADIDEGILASALYAPEVPPVDLLIRTSGEKRLSGFMMYRTAYSELYFTDTYWPDFSVDDLDTALVEFASRERRKGR